MPMATSTSLSVYVLTFNCARTLVQPTIFAPYLFQALDDGQQKQQQLSYDDIAAATDTTNSGFSAAEQEHAESRPELPALFALNLQELAPIAYSFLGGSFLEPYFEAWREVVRVAADLHPRGEQSNGSGKGPSEGYRYVNVVSRNLGMTGVMLFAREDVVGKIAWVQSGGVGVGVAEMGNKGAVGVRLGYRSHSRPLRPDEGREGNEDEEEEEEVQFTFVAAHLAPMEDALERRNRDYLNIVRRLVFVPDPSSKRMSSGDDQAGEETPLLQTSDIPSSSSTPNVSGNESESESGIYSSNSHLFFAGDLNYRTSLLQPSPRDVKEAFPLQSASKDESDPRHFRHLLAHDQLLGEVKAGRTLQGLTEASIAFPPTYKYQHTDPSKAVVLDRDGEWAWATHRWPSWCDRIFFWKEDADADTVTPLPLVDTDSDVKGKSSTKGNLHMQTQRRVTPHRYTCLPLFATSDHRPVALSVSVSLPGPGPPVPGSANDTKNKKGSNAPTQTAPPCRIDPEWRSRRASARNKEILVGVLAYLALTREGRGLLVATALGAVGGWFILRSLLL